MHPIKREDFEKAAKLLADCFVDYPLYVEIFPNERSRWKGVYYCSLYRLIRRQSYTFVDDDVTALAMVKAPGDTEKPFLPMLIDDPRALRILLHLPPRSLLRIISFGRVDSRTQSEFYDPETDVHLQILCSDKHIRGTRNFKSFEEFCEGRPVYCETHTERNVRLYQYYGFSVCKETPWRGITHYAMHADKLERTRRKSES